VDAKPPWLLGLIAVAILAGCGSGQPTLVELDGSRDQGSLDRIVRAADAMLAGDRSASDGGFDGATHPPDLGAGDVADLQGDAKPAPDGPDGGALFLDPLLLYELSAAPYPADGHPDVAVHVPPGFDPARAPGLAIFFHGFNNCVAN